MPADLWLELPFIDEHGWRNSSDLIDVRRERLAQTLVRKIVGNLFNRRSDLYLTDGRPSTEQIVEYQRFWAVSAQELVIRRPGRRSARGHARAAEPSARP